MVLSTGVRAAVDWLFIRVQNSRRRYEVAFSPCSLLIFQQGRPGDRAVILKIRHFPVHLVVCYTTCSRLPLNYFPFAHQSDVPGCSLSSIFTSTKASHIAWRLKFCLISSLTLSEALLTLCIGNSVIRSYLRIIGSRTSTVHQVEGSQKPKQKYLTAS